MRESSRQTLAILGITFFIAGAIFVFFRYLKPAYADFNAKEALRHNKIESIQLLNEYKTKSDEIVAKYEQMGDKINSINAALPINAQPAEVLAILDVVSKTKGLNVSSVVFKEIDNQLTDETQSGLKTIKVDVVLVGTYDSFKGFITELEKEIRLMDAVSLKFQPVTSADKTKKSSSLFSFDFSLNAYYQPISNNSVKP